MDSAGLVRTLASAICALAVSAYITGCGGPSAASGATLAPPETITSSDSGDQEPGATSVEPVDEKYEWEITPSVMASARGTLSTTGQVNIYDIGPVFAGDTLLVEARASSSLDPVVAIMDAEETILLTNDDRDYYAGLMDPLAKVLVRHDSPRCLIAVASSPASFTTGDYTLDVTLTEAEPPEAPRPQQVYFNFEGASAVQIGGRPPIDVPAFDASTIEPRFAGQSSDIIYTVFRMVQEDYTGLNVDFYCSADGPPPAGVYTTVHFGAYDAELLGVAENVDEYNERLNQEAIIFVDTFAAFAGLEPTVEQISQALANVASHETGHLLGLYHTADSRGIMDITASLREMLDDQYFSRFPLHAEVFPMGYQDALRTLVENVGGDLALAISASETQRSLKAIPPAQNNGPPARERLIFSACGQCADAKAKRRAALMKEAAGENEE